MYSQPKRETAPADLTDLTPPQVDAFLTSAYEAIRRVESTMSYDIDRVHRAAGDERQGRAGLSGPWGMSLEDAMAKASEEWAAQYGWENTSVRDIKEARVLLRELKGEITRLNHEFERRGGWSRFFLVTNTGGHIHSSMNCSTCNKFTSRGLSQTKFAWLTELSGQSEEQAVAEKGAILCTVCFPSAPVEWTNKYEIEKAAREAARCKGSGTYLDKNLPHRTGYYSGNWGTCPECKAKPALTSTGKLRAHKPGKLS